MKQIRSGLSRVARRDGAEPLGEVHRPKPPAVLLASWVGLISNTYRLLFCHPFFGGVMCLVNLMSPLAMLGARVRLRWLR